MHFHVALHKGLTETNACRFPHMHQDISFNHFHIFVKRALQLFTLNSVLPNMCVSVRDLASKVHQPLIRMLKKGFAELVYSSTQIQLNGIKEVSTLSKEIVYTDHHKLLHKTRKCTKIHIESTNSKMHGIHFLSFYLRSQNKCSMLW